MSAWLPTPPAVGALQMSSGLSKTLSPSELAAEGCTASGGPLYTLHLQDVIGNAPRNLTCVS